MSTWREYLQAHTADYQQELLAFLRIPSISALPAHAADVQRAAAWTAERLRAAGAEHVQVLPTGGHPVVYGDWLHAPGRPTVLIYGHVDVQPVDPLDLWAHPPFEPFVADDRVYARGATDDKGNLLPAIQAVEALLAAEGALPVNIKFFFEGQEEIGSPQLPAFVAAHRDLLACDLVLSADGGQPGEDTPGLYVGLRGLCAVDVDLYGPSHDLHSGSYGGAVQNPLHAMATLMASLHDADGRVAVAGFYDDVRTFSAAERADMARLPFDVAAFKAELGLSELFGEAGYTPQEQTWIRPTLEINGLWGGFQGEGSKTVLPAEAHAKITCRLVPDQDPARVAGCVAAHLEAHRPAGTRLAVRLPEAGADAYEIPGDNPGNQAAAAVLRELYGTEPYQVRMGGTIPVTALFRKELGAYTVLFAFGLVDELMHSPNEFFRLSAYRRGSLAYAMLLERLGEGAG